MTIREQSYKINNRVMLLLRRYTMSEFFNAEYRNIREAFMEAPFWHNEDEDSYNFWDNLYQEYKNEIREEQILKKINGIVNPKSISDKLKQKATSQ